jgi:ubiquinone/menaquinone biosynthesis C-methylase UbiE
MNSPQDGILVTFLRLFFRLLYHEFAWTYDLVAATVSAGQWQTWIRTPLPYLSGPRILEIGFGPGHLQAELHRRGLHPAGLDASKQMARQAFRRLNRAGYTGRLSVGFTQALPFADSAFDQVLSTFPSDYIFDPKTHAEILRVLAPGGCLVVVPAAWITGTSAHHRLLAWVFRTTHESPPAPNTSLLDHVQKPFRQSGFETEAHLVDYPDSQVLVVIARKPG